MRDASPLQPPTEIGGVAIESAEVEKVTVTDSGPPAPMMRRRRNGRFCSVFAIQKTGAMTRADTNWLLPPGPSLANADDMHIALPAMPPALATALNSPCVVTVAAVAPLF